MTFTAHLFAAAASPIGSGHTRHVRGSSISPHLSCSSSSLQSMTDAWRHSTPRDKSSSEAHRRTEVEEEDEFLPEDPPLSPRRKKPLENVEVKNDSTNDTFSFILTCYP